MNHVMAGDSPHEPRDQATEVLVAAQQAPDAYGEVWDLCRDEVLAYFYWRTFCAHTSNELGAETFALALEVIDRFDPARGSARAWLLGIAANVLRRWRRRHVVSERSRRRLGIQTPTASHDDLVRIESLVDASHFRVALRDALELLSPRVRDAVLLRVADDRPYAEVAEMLGCSIGAARVRVARGVHRLQVLMDGVR